jgi:plastocyanin
MIKLTNAGIIFVSTLAAATLTGCPSMKSESPGNAVMSATEEKMAKDTEILPDAAASKVVSMANAGTTKASILVQTQRVAVKETGPKATIAKFGEVYSWSPAFFAVHQDEPTQIRFWNLQPDDLHDFMLISPTGQVLMRLLLPPLSDKSWVFAFHEQGLYTFICSVHQPDMYGQILVLPPVSQ